MRSMEPLIKLSGKTNCHKCTATASSARMNRMQVSTHQVVLLITCTAAHEPVRLMCGGLGTVALDCI